MKIGKYEFKNPLALAPMEDVTELPFRLICKRMGADIVYTEFTSSEAIIRDIPSALKKIKVLDEERPVGIQIFGGLDESMEKAAGIVEKFQPDIIDINCGCWVKNNVAQGSGASLLKDLPRFEKIVKSTVRGTKLPVAVKTRLGWDMSSIVILDVAKMVEAAGAQALTLHCRTRDQAHDKAPADWTWLEKVKKVISIPLIANGDIRTPEDVKRVFDTGCDGAMIGRGAIINPWIFKQAKHYLATGELLSPPTLKEKIELCIEHIQLSVKMQYYAKGIMPFRKHFAGYLKGLPNVASLRADVMRIENLEELVARLNRFVDENENVPIYS